MKYCFTTLAVGEPYESITKKFFSDLSAKTKHCDFFVTTTNKEFSHECERVKINVINPPALRTTHNWLGFNFNVNLKCLSFKHVLNYQKKEREKNSNFENYDFVIFCDGDWSMHEEFSEEKVLSMLESTKNEGIDFLFERPAAIWGGKQDPSVCFYRNKLVDYDILEHNKWDEAHVVNEQFLVFKNNAKFRFFVQRWEMFLWYSIANDITNYAEGFEIGVSAHEADMKYAFYGYFNHYLTNCFTFFTKNGDKHIRF
jgi:hypothetical protein